MRNDPRVTRISRLLRKYSLDEFPGSGTGLVGDEPSWDPPPLPSEVLSYEDHVRRRLYIKPGLTTGMWQVNGRSALSWEERASGSLRGELVRRR
jgi:lipopolysaccharide/colanic/teichoic acid biosynthesis glycosyltransferase